MGNIDSTPVNIEGTIYWIGNNKVRSLNLKTNLFVESPTLRFSAGSNYNAPLAYDSGRLYTAKMYGATCIDATTGNIVWERNYSSTNYSTTNNSFKNSVVISGNLAYVASYTGSSGQHCLYAIDKATGVIGSWAATDQNYIIASGNRLTAFDKKNHAKLWQVPVQHILDKDTIPVGDYLGVSDLLHYNNYILQYAAWVNPDLPGLQTVLSNIYVTDSKTGKTVLRIPIGKEIPTSYPVKYG